MTDDAPFEPDRLVAALNDASVGYVIVGGLAVAAHGVIRATRDLDVVPDPRDENMDRLATVLVGLGGQHPVEDCLTGPALARPVSFKVRTAHGDLQVLNRMAGIPPYDDLRRDCVPVEIAESVVAPVCSLEHLLQMKRAAGRPRDLVDLEELEQLNGAS